ncbi:MAG: hypothetical protein RSD40_00230 [Bacilli bacterium]
MGNDFSVGSESLSIGSLSGSFQRPVERKEIAPGVDTLLQAARVFFFQEFSLLKSNECNSNGEREDLENYVTTNFADNRYLAKVQPNAQKGSVATIGESNQIVFSNPTEISFSYINANKIYDPATKDEFKIINEVENIAFFGMNFSGPYSAVRRGELYNLLAYTTMN